MRAWLKSMRKKHRLKQKDVAEKIGVSQQMYSFIENEKKQQDLKLGTVEKLSKVFDVPVAQIIDMERRK